MTVRVRRDARGIPHLWGDDVLELAHAQGRETALDRAWPMEHHRWRMEGRTAEFVGAGGVAWDRFARQVRLEHSARECYERLAPETQEWVDAYVTGVNEGMPLGLPGAHEMRMLDLEAYAAAPRPWEPWTPLGIFWGIHVLFGTFPAKLWRAHVADRLGADWLPLLSAEDEPGSGSNAWVVGGHRTATGMPLIAGDPHRTIDLPSCYQQIGLACTEFDVVGFAFPGVPGVLHFAHAGSVAWGITNAMADYQDLTLEELRRSPSGAMEARGIDGWEPAQRAMDTVAVRGAQSAEVEVVVTRRGPVVTGLDGDGKTYSLRTPSQVGADLGFGAFLPLLRSRSVDDVVSALSAWVEPVNSVLVADTTGRMTHLVAGRLPKRHPDNQWLPVPAWDPRHVWEGGWAARPVTPIDEFMVSANDRASGGGLGVEYANAFRANRIRELIDETEALTVEACAAIHVDVVNGQAGLMRELVEAVDGSEGGAGGANGVENAAATPVRERLLAWDGRCDIDSTGAALFASWRHHLVHWFARHPALAVLHEPTGHSSLIDPWLDVPRQLGAAWPALARGGATRGIDVAAGVRSALAATARDLAADGAPRWGHRHRLEPLHALGSVPAPPELRVALAGDRGCVLAAVSTPGVTDACSFGPVARYVWSLADRDASRWVVPFGSSARADSPHVADQLEAWVRGRLFPVAELDD